MYTYILQNMLSYVHACMYVRCDGPVFTCAITNIVTIFLACMTKSY